MTIARKPTLVTGSHRSGTTWTGKMLALAPKTVYIHEPFNINNSDVIESSFINWFQYVCEENSCQHKEELRKIFTYYYPLRFNLSKARSFRDIKKIARDQSKLLYYRANSYTPIVKDPIAVFSAGWLSETFNMNVLVMIRHPAAFCSSLKLKGWKYDFSNFLKQPLLMKQFLKKFEDDIREYAANEKDIISQAILLWNCIHHTVNIYKDKYPEWIFVKHEELSSDPVAQFRKIYASLNLEFTPKAQSCILDSSSAHNPTEQVSGNEFIRNSKANIYNWKNRLTLTEIERIKESTIDISKLFYTKYEW